MRRSKTCKDNCFYLSPDSQAGTLLTLRDFPPLPRGRACVFLHLTKFLLEGMSLPCVCIHPTECLLESMGPTMALIMERQKLVVLPRADTPEQPMIRGQAVKQTTNRKFSVSFPSQIAKGCSNRLLLIRVMTFSPARGPSPRIWPCIPNCMAKCVIISIWLLLPQWLHCLCWHWCPIHPKRKNLLKT